MIPRTSIRRSARRALTLTETLVAVAISLVFLGSVTTAYIQISRAADNAEAQVAAHARARVAIDTVLRDISQVRTDPTLPPQDFVLLSNSLTFGDNIDNDDDGAIDEEVFDGLDNDADWNAPDDNHAQVGAFPERPDYVGVPDLGDFHVDEDCVFSRDVLILRIPADPSGAVPARRIQYRIDTFDGNDNALIRRVTTDPGGPAESIEEQPVIFEAVSLDILVLNPNDDVVSPVSPKRPYWQPNWNAAAIRFPAQTPIGAPFGTPPFKFPAAVLVRIVVNGESLPLAEVRGWPLGNRPLRTVALQSIATIDEVINSAVYRDNVREDIGP